MCYCQKPTLNGTEGNFKNHLYAPEIKDGESIIFDEPGRCGALVEGATPIDYHSHHFRLVKEECGDISLLVRHGGGDERITEYGLRKLPEVLSKLDSDSRYLILHAFLDVHHKAERTSRENTRQTYNKAFIEGRLKKRKQRRDNFYRVWIEPSKEPSHA